MLREELSSGSELTAAWMLVNSPKAASCLTITAPEGGDVRDSRFARLSLAEILEDQIRKARKELPKWTRFHFAAFVVNFLIAS